MAKVSNIRIQKMAMITCLVMALALAWAGAAGAAEWTISADEYLNTSNSSVDYEVQALVGTWDRVMAADSPEEVVRISLYNNGVGRLTTLNGAGTTVAWSLEAGALVLQATDGAGSAAYAKSFKSDGTLALSDLDTGAVSTWYKSN